MKYVVIDTCILKSSLIGRSSYSKDLKQIKDWIDKGLITFCSPSSLIEEWNKHKEIEKNLIDKELKAKTRDLQLSGLYEISAIESGEKNARRVLSNQIDDIDQIINNGNQIELSEKASHIILKQQKQNLPPFHNKKKSLNDAILIFSMLDFANSNAIQEFYFVSSNHTEFGDKDEPTAKLNNEISSIYSNVNVRYFVKSSDFIESLIEEGLPRLEEILMSETESSQIEDNIVTFRSGRRNKLIGINQEQHLLVQLNELHSAIYRELDFVPLNVLVKQPPYSIDAYGRYDNFVLRSNNVELQVLSESVEINNQSEVKTTNSSYFDGIENPEKVLKKILRKSTSNLIYYVSTPNERDYIDFRLFQSTSCKCARCQIENFSFRNIDFELKVKDNDIDEMLNQAYGHYKLGHFKKVYGLYQEALKLAISEQRELTKYLILYNLSHLASLIQANYYLDEESKKIVKELRAIDISDTHCLAQNEFHRDIQEWMLNDYYIKYFHTAICETKQQLVDHYHNSINGGSGSNNHINELINQYAQLHQFLQQNTIINDCYKPYHDIVEMVTEGLFASLAIEGDRHSKIDSLNDWLISEILKFGRTRSIRKLAHRYKLKKIKYEDRINGGTIKDQILRLFEQFEDATKKLNSVKEPNYNYFSNEYKKWLNNSLYLVGLIDFDQKFIKKFTNTFIAYYRRDTHRLDTIEIVSFLVRKYHLLNKTQLKEFLLMGIRDDQLMRSYLLENLSIICEEQNIKLKISQRDFKLISQRPFNTLSNIVSLVQVHRCLEDENQKLAIKNRLLEELEDSFRLDIWNSSVLHDVISMDDDHLNKAIEILTPRKDVVGKPASFFGASNYSGGLNEFIRVCYKFRIELTKKKFDGLREHSLYYQWLLDVDGFNYKEFDTSWLMEYGTDEYFEHFSRSEVLRKFIEEKMSDIDEKNREKLREAYMDIYVLKNWK